MDRRDNNIVGYQFIGQQEIWLKTGDVVMEEVHCNKQDEGKEEHTILHPYTERVIIVTFDEAYVCWKECCDQEMYHQVEQVVRQLGMDSSSEAEAWKEMLNLLLLPSPFLALREKMRIARRICEMTRDDPDKQLVHKQQGEHLRVYEQALPAMALCEAYSIVTFNDGTFWIRNVIGAWNNEAGWREAPVIHPKTGKVFICRKHATTIEWIALGSQHDQKTERREVQFA